MWWHVHPLLLWQWQTVTQALLIGLEKVNENFGHFNTACAMVGDLAVLHLCMLCNEYHIFPNPTNPLQHIPANPDTSDIPAMLSS
jgi:hypothetical protein